MPNKVEIEIRGRKFVCPHFTDVQAMFFGTLIMTKEEIGVFVDDENPSLAFQMMSDRLQTELLEFKQKAKGTEEEVNEAINVQFSERTAALLTSRIVMDRDPMSFDKGTGLTERLAKRLREIFPTLPTEWVSDKGIYLDLQEIITAVAVPLYSYLGSGGKEEPEPAPTAPAPITPPEAMPVIEPAPGSAILANPPASVVEVAPPQLSDTMAVTLKRSEIDELPAELRAKLGIS